MVLNELEEVLGVGFLRHVHDEEADDSDPPDTVVALEWQQLAIGVWSELDFHLEDGGDLWGEAAWMVAGDEGLTLGAEHSLLGSGEPLLRRQTVVLGVVTTVVEKSWVASVVVLEGGSEFVQGNLEGLLLWPRVLVVVVGAANVAVGRVQEALDHWGAKVLEVRDKVVVGFHEVCV